jgi:hypothetical protein
MKRPRIFRGLLKLGRHSTPRRNKYRAVTQPESSYVCWKPILALASTELALPNGSVDPTGFEPASATVARCCVPITPRARRDSTHWGYGINVRWSHVRRILARNGRATDALTRWQGRPRHMAKSCLHLLSARPRTLPAGCPRGRCASCASCLPSVSRAACVCA